MALCNLWKYSVVNKGPGKPRFWAFKCSAAESPADPLVQPGLRWILFVVWFQAAESPEGQQDL